MPVVLVMLIIFILQTATGVFSAPMAPPPLPRVLSKVCYMCPHTNLFEGRYMYYGLIIVAPLLLPSLIYILNSQENGHDLIF